MKLLRFFFILACCGMPLFSLLAEEVEYVWNVTVDVNNRDPQASDGDPTTPFRTIQAAATNAMGYARAGKSVLVRVHPGVYRESVTLRGKVDESNAAIKFEGTDPGNVVINGAQIVNGWDIGEFDIFELPWIPTKENPAVFVEGARLVEVASPRQVMQGQVCFVRGKEPKIYLLPPKGGVVKNGTVEISGMGVGIRAENVDGLYLESLAFERGFDAAIDVHGGDGLIINNVAIEYAHGDGLRLADLDKVRIRRLIVDRCGGNGIVLERLGALAMSGTEVKLNNWSRRTDDLAGLKISGCGQVKVWSLKASENHGAGLWMADTTHQSALSKVVAVNNGTGAIFENNQDIASLTECQFAYNRDGGVVLKGGGLYLMANVFYGNGGAQITLADCDQRSELQASRNIIVARKGELLIDVEARDHGLLAEKNLYESPSKEPFRALGEPLTFIQWQEVASLDLDSYLGEAKLLDPENYGFTPAPQSPYFKMSSWPVRELD
ncbi:right-handed parallel beta-helix repeat-containing protein [Cerasicoccus fimbriatus]|uniref:right-handed parallel beta-helix repeat-containing protein n=1 Tax=Cerasicoccus fimbriatus TaxID=3014554 RepID=UPI0022B3008C|nr:right-handed parallel beta-helix repeat-containing protein [Cerasicoccus sp. TK19100]